MFFLKHIVERLGNFLAKIRIRLSNNGYIEQKIEQKSKGIMYLWNISLVKRSHNYFEYFSSETNNFFLLSALPLVFCWTDYRYGNCDVYSTFHSFSKGGGGGYSRQFLLSAKCKILEITHSIFANTYIHTIQFIKKRQKVYEKN